MDLLNLEIHCIYRILVTAIPGSIFFTLTLIWHLHEQLQCHFKDIAWIYFFSGFAAFLKYENAAYRRGCLFFGNHMINSV